MNIKAILKIIGSALCIESLFMIPCIIIAFTNKEAGGYPFLITSVLLFAIGAPLVIINIKSSKFHIKDGLLSVALSWILISIAGAMPYYFSGVIPQFINSLFESVSGFSTTGATILTDVEALPKSMLLWRCLTLWFGGMGILILTLAIIPSAGSGGIYIMKAEITGPSPSRLVPKLRKTAIILYSIYISLTLLEIICLIATGMGGFDSIIHALSTAGTGGFSNKNLSIGAYDNAAVDVIITIFMYLFGINFAIYFTVFSKSIFQAFKSEEFRVYSVIILISIILVTFNIFNIYGKNLILSLRYSAFQVTSIISTTGFATADFNCWPPLSKMVLLILMFIGSCATSTGGGMKVIRFIIMFKSARLSYKKILHPRITQSVIIDGHIVDEGIIKNVWMFSFLYIFIIIVASLLISFENYDMSTSISSVISMIGNTGAGFGSIGALGNYSLFTSFSKIVLCFCMLLGRLEILPILFLLTPKKRYN